MPAEAGDMGVRKLSFLGFVAEVEVDILAFPSFSGSGVGGKAPGISTGRSWVRRERAAAGVLVVVRGFLPASVAEIRAVRVCWCRR